MIQRLQQSEPVDFKPCSQKTSENCINGSQMREHSIFLSFFFFLHLLNEIFVQVTGTKEYKYSAKGFMADENAANMAGILDYLEEYVRDKKVTYQGCFKQCIHCQRNQIPPELEDVCKEFKFLTSKMWKVTAVNE